MIICTSLFVENSAIRALQPPDAFHRRGFEVGPDQGIGHDVSKPYTLPTQLTADPVNRVPQIQNAVHLDAIADAMAPKRSSTAFSLSLISLVALGLSACATAPQKSAPTPAQPPKTTSALDGLPPPPPLSSQAQQSLDVLVGEMAANRNEPKTGADALLRAAEQNGDADLARRATTMALQANDLDLSLQAGTLWLKLDPTSMDAREILLRLNLLKGDLPATLDQARAMIKDDPAGPDESYRNVALLLSQNRATKALSLEVMKQLVADAPKSAEAHHGMGLLALRLDELNVAETEARESTQLAPNDSAHALLLVGVLVREKAFDAAESEMERLLKIKGVKVADSRLSYAQLLIEADRIDLAEVQLKKVLQIDPKNADARYAMALIQMRTNHEAQAKANFEALRNDSDHGQAARAQLGLIAEREGRLDDALKLYESVTTGPEALDAAAQRARVLAHLGRIDEARSILESIAEQFPPLAPSMTQLESQLLIEAGKNTDALEVLNSALAQRPSDPDLLYMRSLALENEGKFEAAETDLRTILKSDPNSAQALNALGYMLTVHTTRYAEAEQMIRAALTQMPNDPAVIDSLGWVLFKQGKMDEARTQLERAWNDGNDAEIGAHYGELLWTTGHKDEARAVWNKALEKNPDQPAVKETMDRLSK